jgi:hypothetical protein
VSAVKKGETKEMTLATAGFVSQDMLTDPFFPFHQRLSGFAWTRSLITLVQLQLGPRICLEREEFRVPKIG